jgi:hypothetical protein
MLYRFSNLLCYYYHFYTLFLPKEAFVHALINTIYGFAISHHDIGHPQINLSIVFRQPFHPLLALALFCML